MPASRQHSLLHKWAELHRTASQGHSARSEGPHKWEEKHTPGFRLELSVGHSKLAPRDPAAGAAAPP